MLQYTKKLRVVPENSQQGQDLAVKIHKKTAELRASPRWKGGRMIKQKFMIWNRTMQRMDFCRPDQ